ncbi:SPOR domain-containing protein [Candidatus Magnetomonas plexicatena]|uniref:SPOR domain-containing protein n=1 Tax=Candidatus Magnetomonas plexicatena TaxID=2552947 RepID=UPI001C76A838|nr:response regulator [Nitrospirales bacterium LBB_01]
MESKNILVIDDDKTNVQQISEMLRIEGFTVYTASSKAEAVELALKTLPALVFVKSMLMDASGYEIIRDIRSEELVKDTRFIVLTEIDKTYDDRYRSIYKIVDSVKLPVDRHELIAKASKYVEIDMVSEDSGGGPGSYQYEEKTQEGIQLDKPVNFKDTDRLRYAKDDYEIKTSKEHLSEDSFSKERDDIVKFNRHREEETEIEETEFEEIREEKEQDKTKELEDTMYIHDMEPDDDSVDSDKTDEAVDITAIDADDAEEYLQKLNEDRAKKKRMLIIGVSAVFVLILVTVYLFSRGGKVSHKKQEVATVVEPRVLDKALEEPQQTSEPAPPIEPEPVPAPVKAAAEKPVAKPTPVTAQHKPSPGIEKPSVTPAAKAESTTGPVHQNKDKQSKKPVAAEDKPKVEKPVKQEKSEGIYSIQLGSFKDPANAKKFVENLKKEGYSAFIKDSMGKDVLWHKVYVGKYKKKEDAAAVINKLKAGGKLEVILKKI